MRGNLLFTTALSLSSYALYLRCVLFNAYFLGSFPQTEPSSLFFTGGTLVLVLLPAASFCLLAPLLNEPDLVPSVFGLSDFLNIDIPESDLILLADARSKAVKGYLANKAELEANRLFLLNTQHDLHTESSGVELTLEAK